METKDLTAVVTGASRGLGAGIAREFSRLGLRLGLCSRSAPVLPDGERVVIAELDVSDEPALRRFAERVTQRFGSIDLWINNAGVTGPIGPLRKAPPDEIAHTLSVNILGVVNGTRVFVDVVRRQAAPGVLVNMSSGAARSPYPGLAMYCASKAAVDRLTECVQLEEAGTGLRAYSIAPGVIESAMQLKLRAVAEEDLPVVEWFREVKRRGAFSSPAFVARQILAVAFETRPAAVAIALPLEHPLP